MDRSGESGRSDRHNTAVLVTTAAPSPAQERRDRERRYLITMGFRVLAIIVALVVATGWIRVVAILASVILPWVAVVAANNSGPKRRTESPSLFFRRHPKQIER